MLKRISGSHLAILFVAAAVIALTVPSALAFTQSGGAINKVKAVTPMTVNSIAAIGANTTFTTVTSADGTAAQTNIHVDPGQSALLVIRFSAESKCSGAVGANCRVQILVTPPAGGLAYPKTPTYAFDSTSPGAPPAGRNARAMDRFLKVPGAFGDYTVTVQYATGPGATGFQLRNWSLIVERAGS